MAIISEYAWVDVLAILMAIVVGIITYFKWAFGYWKRKNIPYAEPSIPFGSFNLGNPEAFCYLIKRQYDQFKATQQMHCGMYIITQPIYFPLAPEYIKNILTKDFNYFVDRSTYYNEKDDPLSAHLFALEASRWRPLRMKLTPTFTSGKMKMMFPTLVECGKELNNAMNEFCLKNEATDIKDMLGRFTMDVIGSCAFGLECNSFKDPNSEFRVQANRTLRNTQLEKLKIFLTVTFPKLARYFRLTIVPKEPAAFFINVTKQTVAYREKNNYVRKDFMQILIDLKNGVKEEDSRENKHDYDTSALTVEEIAAQAFLFFVAGFETSATTMTFCLFELALNDTIQEKVRQEVNTVLENHDGKFSYDAIMEMKYLRQVIDETLRKYPPISALGRQCVADYELPGTSTIIEKGTNVFIPVIGLHHDERYFPEPEKFDPERFNEKDRGTKIKPFTYMPFGDGPRNCIGLRFGIMQTKVGLSMLLKNYKFSLNSKTQVPLQMDPSSFILSPLGNIWLDVQKVED